jgi:hypothetical protein
MIRSYGSPILPAQTPLDRRGTSVDRRRELPAGPYSVVHQGKTPQAGCQTLEFARLWSELPNLGLVRNWTVACDVQAGPALTPEKHRLASGVTGHRVHPACQPRLVHKGRQAALGKARNVRVRRASHPSCGEPWGRTPHLYDIEAAWSRTSLERGLLARVRAYPEAKPST